MIKDNQHGYVASVAVTRAELDDPEKHRAIMDDLMGQVRELDKILRAGGWQKGVGE